MNQTTDKELTDLRIAVGRIEERINSLSRERDEHSDDTHKSFEDIRANAKAIVDTIDKKLNNYVTKESFRPVEMISFGLAGSVLLAAITAVMKLVIVQ